MLLDYLQDFSAPDLRPLQEREFEFRVLRVARDAVPVSRLRAVWSTSGALGQSDNPGARQGLWANPTILLLLELPNTSFSSRDKQQLGTKVREQW